MKIRTRLTLWYAGILLAALFFITGWAYYELFFEHRLPGDMSAFPDGEPVLEELAEALLFGGLPAMLLALVGGWFLMTRALAPITRLTKAIERINEGNLHQRLPCSETDDELNRLTQVFNDMTARLDESFQRIRDFTLHASHELKTPLAIMHATLESTWAEDSLSDAERERVASQLEEVQRLAKIVDELTLLTKADAGLLTLDHDPLRLDELVRETFEDLRILAEQRNLTARLDQCDEVRIIGDRNRLRQVLLNLSDNAVKYNRSGGSVILALRRDGQWAELTFRNTGPGLSPELQSRVFDRFFRSDTSPSHEEGCGLGLSIVRCIVHLHDGAITFNSNPATETTVTVRLPAAESHV